MLKGCWLLSDLDGTLIATPHKANGQYLSLEVSPCYGPIRRWLRNGGSVCIVTTADKRVLEQVYAPLRRFLEGGDRSTPDTGILMLSLYTGAVLYRCTASALVPEKEYVYGLHYATEESILIARRKQLTHVFESSEGTEKGASLSVRGTCFSTSVCKQLIELVTDIFFTYMSDLLHAKPSAIDSLTKMSTRYRLLWKLFKTYLDGRYEAFVKKGKPSGSTDPQKWKVDFMRSKKDILLLLGIVRVEEIGAWNSKVEKAQSSAAVQTSKEVSGSASNSAAQRNGNDSGSLGSTLSAAVPDSEREPYVINVVHAHEKDRIAASGMQGVLAAFPNGTQPTEIKCCAGNNNNNNNNQRECDPYSTLSREQQEEQEKLEKQEKLRIGREKVVEALKDDSPDSVAFARRVTRLLGAEPCADVFFHDTPVTPSTSDGHDVMQLIIVGIPLVLYDHYFVPFHDQVDSVGVTATAQPNSVVFSKMGISKSTAVRYLTAGKCTGSHHLTAEATTAGPSNHGGNEHVPLKGIVDPSCALALGDNPHMADYELTVFPNVTFLSLEKAPQRTTRHTYIDKLVRSESPVTSPIAAHQRFLWLNFFQSARKSDANAACNGVKPSVPSVEDCSRRGALMDDRLFSNIRYIGGEEDGTAVCLAILMNHLEVPSLEGDVQFFSDTAKLPQAYLGKPTLSQNSSVPSTPVSPDKSTTIRSFTAAAAPHDNGAHEAAGQTTNSLEQVLLSPEALQAVSTVRRMYNAPMQTHGVDGSRTLSPDEFRRAVNFAVDSASCLMSPIQDLPVMNSHI